MSYDKTNNTKLIKQRTLVITMDGKRPEDWDELRILS